MPSPRRHSVEERTLPAAITSAAGLLTAAGAPPNSKYRSNEGATLLYSRLEKWDGTSRLVLAFHGHGATSNQFGMNAGPGAGCLALARTGRYVVLSIDGGPTTSEWGGPMAMSAINDARDWARTHGVMAGKYAEHGWSMGGLTVLNHMRRDPNCVGAWLWVPAIDLDYFNSTAGYVPDYGAALPANATWTSEISNNAVPYGAYRPAATLTAAANVPASTTPVGSGVTVNVDEGRRFNDCWKGRGTVGMGASSATYGSRDATHLYDVISTGAAFSPASGLGIGNGYATNHAGFNPYAEPGDFAPAVFGPTRKITLALSSDDTTIPPAMADAWLPKVGNPNIAPTAKSKTLGNHTNLFQFYTDADVVNFYDSLDWS